MIRHSQNTNVPVQFNCPYTKKNDHCDRRHRNSSQHTKMKPSQEDDDRSRTRRRRQSKDRQIGEADKEEEKKHLFKDAVQLLGPYDVLCGRGSLAFNNIGNRRFRELIGMNVGTYNKAQGRHQKGEVIRSLVATLRNQIGVRFFKLKDGKLVELTERQIRQKVGHALRDVHAFQEKQQQLPQKHRDRDHCHQYGTSNWNALRPNAAVGSATALSESSIARDRVRERSTPDDTIRFQGRNIPKQLHIVSPKQRRLHPISPNWHYAFTQRQFLYSSEPTHLSSASANNFLAVRAHDSGLRSIQSTHQRYHGPCPSIGNTMASSSGDTNNLHGEENLGKADLDGIDLSPIPINEHNQERDEDAIDMVRF